MNATLTKLTHDNIEITTIISYDKLDVWNSLTGSGFAGSLNNWITDIDLDNWDIPCDLDITYLDIADNIQKKTISVMDIYMAFGHLVEHKFTHCGGYAISDLDNSDSCFADLLLQVCVFGEVVFG